MDDIASFHIYDQDYSLRVGSESNAARLAKITDLVDHKMKEVAACYINLSAKQIAVLAALNLADDYIEIQERLISDQSDNGGYPDYDACLPAYIEKIESFLEVKGQ
ncbi:MAG: cell division protein ZapA [Spirochaetota bacterium]|nr:cell division protein ZapA [Spirochaetota bacterium]